MKLHRLFFFSFLFLSFSSYAQNTPQEYDDYYAQMDKLIKDYRTFKNSEFYKNIEKECDDFTKKLGDGCPYPPNMEGLSGTIIIPFELNDWIKDNLEKTAYKSYDEAVAAIAAIKSKSQAVSMAAFPFISKATMTSKKYKGFFSEFIREANNPYAQ